MNTTLRQLVRGLDANVACTLAEARRVTPGLEAPGVGWPEEPFPAHDADGYALAAGFARVPLAAGENHYTRFGFLRPMEERALSILQPDRCKAGGVIEVLRIAALASARRLALHPHTSVTGRPYEVGPGGCVRPLEPPGIGVEVDESFLAAHPVIEGSGYV